MDFSRIHVTAYYLTRFQHPSLPEVQRLQGLGKTSCRAECIVISVPGRLGPRSTWALE